MVIGMGARMEWGWGWVRTEVVHVFDTLKSGPQRWSAKCNLFDSVDASRQRQIEKKYLS